MATDLHADAIASLANGGHGAPFDILGVHQVDDTHIVIRGFRPVAKTMSVIETASGARHDMNKIHESGLFEVTIEGAPDLNYQLDITTKDDINFQIHDAYSFDPVLTDYDLHLLGEGRHLYSYEKLGAHLMEINGVKGVHFAVWAPNAHRVSVIGDFNIWDERVHPMRRHPNGIWELFIPAVAEGDIYRYDINSQNMGYRVKKSDPYGFAMEKRPNNASIVYRLDNYTWNDDAWMEQRAEGFALDKPMSTYEVHMGSWKRNLNGEWMTYREIAHDLVAYCKDIGYTHIELMPVSEHPFDGSWGYQVTGYYAVSSRFGTPDDFRYFVDYCHQNDIGIILDWVPAHFPKDINGLGYFDGTHLYEHADPRKGEHPDWGTYIFNYGRNEVRNFLLSNAVYWLKEFHIDGLRVDAVSSMLYLDFSREDGQWVANQYGSNENLEAISFMKEFNEVVHEQFPGAVTIAEESTAWAMVSRPTYIGGLGFTLKWNMGWMHDTLEYMAKDPIYRRYDHHKLTFSMIYAFTENFVLSLSHDEVVHGKGSLINKMSGDWWQKFANLRTLYGYMYTHPGKKLLFMGQEFGQWREWSEERGLDWDLLQWPTHQRLQAWVRDLNTFYKNEPALYEVDFDDKGFQWIDANDADNSIYSYIRFSKKKRDFVIAIMNMTPVIRRGYRIGVPQAGFYKEVLNSDSEHYGGSNVGNDGGVQSEEQAWNDWTHSIELTLPPLGIVILKLQRDENAAQVESTAIARQPEHEVVEYAEPPQDMIVHEEKQKKLMKVKQDEASAPQKKSDGDEGAETADDDKQEA